MAGMVFFTIQVTQMNSPASSSACTDTLGWHKKSASRLANGRATALALNPTEMPWSNRWKRRSERTPATVGDIACYDGISKGPQYCASARRTHEPSTPQCSDCCPHGSGGGIRFLRGRDHYVCRCCPHPTAD